MLLGEKGKQFTERVIEKLQAHLQCDLILSQSTINMAVLLISQKTELQLRVKVLYSLKEELALRLDEVPPALEKLVSLKVESN